MRQWLVDIRKKNKMSQYKAAELAGMSQSYYAAIEKGTRGNPVNVEFAKKIAKVLGFDWTRFYQDESEQTA